MDTKSTRTCLGPLTAISFFAIGGTGLLMFFHVRIPAMTTLHELGGILFVIVTAIHLGLNIRPLTSYCKQTLGRVAIGVSIGLMALFLVIGLLHDEHHRKLGVETTEDASIHSDR